MSDEDNGIHDLTTEEAVQEHEAGSMHCCTPGRWRQVKDLFDPDDHPWLKGHMGQFAIAEIGNDFALVCIDTEGLTEEQQNFVLANFYSVRDEEKPGVMMLDKDSNAANTMHQAKLRGKKRKD